VEGPSLLAIGESPRLRRRADEIVEVAIERPLPGRLDGLPTIVVTLKDGVAVRIASLDGLGTASEIARRITGLTDDVTAA
jgi:hypothetical protein